MAAAAAASFTAARLQPLGLKHRFPLGRLQKNDLCYFPKLATLPELRLQRGRSKESMQVLVKNSNNWIFGHSNKEVSIFGVLKGFVSTLQLETTTSNFAMLLLVRAAWMFGIWFLGKLERNEKEKLAQEERLKFYSDMKALMKEMIKEGLTNEEIAQPKTNIITQTIKEEEDEVAKIQTTKKEEDKQDQMETSMGRRKCEWNEGM